VIPIVRAPDDPGVDDESERDDFDGQGGVTAQAGGWRGFVARWVG
jgi:HemY protein